MLRFTLVLGLALAIPSFGADALASEDAEAQVPEHLGNVGQRRAEFNRLTQEMERLAQRNAWPGVERSYQSLVETGFEPTFEAHVMGAHAARALGDVTSAHQRLLSAHSQREDREVLQWLSAIDSNYGRVSLAADAGKVELAIEAMPFNPDEARAVEFARQQIAETGRYDGFLPKGNYTFGAHEVEVRPRVHTQRIDIRTDEGLRERRSRRNR